MNGNRIASDRWVKALMISSRLFMVSGAAFFLLQCNSPEQRRADPVFDSLVQSVKLKLKTNADSALRASDVLFHYADGKPDHGQLLEAAGYRGSAFELSGKNDSALKYYSIMRAEAFRLKDTSKMIHVSYLLGSLFIEMESNDSVAFWLRKGMALAVQTHDTAEQAKFLTHIGNYYLRCNQSDSAMQCFTRAVLYYLKTADSVSLAQAYRNLGNLLVNQGFQRKAIPLFLSAIQINQRLGKKIEVGLDYSNIAIAYKKVRKDSAYYYFQMAMKPLTESGSISNLMVIKFNYANYLKSNGDIAAAEILYKEVLQISIVNHIQQGELYSLNMLAKTAVIRKDQAGADLYFDKALKFASGNKLTNDILRICNDRFEGYLALNNAAGALKYYTLWNKMNDSLQTITQQDAVVKYQTLYEAEKKNMEIKLLETEREKDRIKSRYIYMLFLFSMLAVIAVLYVIWLRGRNTRQRLIISETVQKSQQLELNNKELLIINKDQETALDKKEIETSQRLLVSKMLILSHNSEFLSGLLTELQFLNQKLDNTEQQESLKIILASLKSQVQPKRWDDFQQQYMESHKDFFRKLNEIHPGLTAGDHRLCAMLRMNLSIKEITELTLQNPRAVEMARHRLRQKFGIERDENLNAYLAQF